MYVTLTQPFTDSLLIMYFDMHYLRRVKKKVELFRYILDLPFLVIPVYKLCLHNILMVLNINDALIFCMIYRSILWV